jgi:hypothetical protein
MIKEKGDERRGEAKKDGLLQKAYMAEAKICPDGSSVSGTGANRGIMPCP